MRSMNLALAAGAAMALIAAAEPVSHPAPTSRKGSVRRERHRVTSYTPKTPKTPADFERLRRAEMKRQRKALKRAQDARS